MKKRMMAGFNMKPAGIFAPGEPIKCIATIPEAAEIQDILVDGAGNFVLFAEVQSHHPDTQVRHLEHEVMILATKHEIPSGFDYYKTLVAGPGIFHIFLRPPEAKKGAIRLM